ncbi:MAG: hypothetical protein LVS60_14100 [Nodosilinea sp. LVE1205-7]
MDTTFAEAQALAGQLQKTRLPHGSLVLVSDAYHLRRSRWVVAHYLSCCFEGAEVGLKTAATVPLTWRITGGGGGMAGSGGGW